MHTSQYRGGAAILRICRHLSVRQRTLQQHPGFTYSDCRLLHTSCWRAHYQSPLGSLHASAVKRKILAEEAPNSPVYKHLIDRGLINNITGDLNEFKRLVDNGKVGVYAGIDPTASSPHIGNLMVFMALFHFWLRGHKTLFLIGDATAAIGDPSGRSTERQMMDADELSKMRSRMVLNMHLLLERVGQYAFLRGYDDTKYGTIIFESNKKWFNYLTVHQFFQQVGPKFRVGQMLARESVKSRMEVEEGISYGEFSYQLLQAFDFKQLYEEKGITLQIGGSDQWGNITAGVEFIAKSSPNNQLEPETRKAYGMTVPLLVTAGGEKYGKSAGNAIWLDKTMTTPLQLYQTTDADVERLLKLLTLLSLEEIEVLMETHSQAPHERRAQHTLAWEVLEMIHGRKNATIAKEQSALLKSLLGGEGAQELTGFQLREQFEQEPEFYIKLHKHEVLGVHIAKVASVSGAVESRSVAVALIQQGGLSVGKNKQKVTRINEEITEEMLIDGVLILRVGKNKIRLVDTEHPALLKRKYRASLS